LLCFFARLVSLSECSWCSAIPGYVSVRCPLVTLVSLRSVSRVLCVSCLFRLLLSSRSPFLTCLIILCLLLLCSSFSPLPFALRGFVLSFLLSSLRGYRVASSVLSSCYLYRPLCLLLFLFLSCLSLAFSRYSLVLSVFSARFRLRRVGFSARVSFLKVLMPCPFPCWSPVLLSCSEPCRLFSPASSGLRLFFSLLLLFCCSVLLSSCFFVLLLLFFLSIRTPAKSVFVHLPLGFSIYSLCAFFPLWFISVLLDPPLLF